MNNRKTRVARQARRLGLQITQDLYTGNYRLTWSNGITCADNVPLDDAELIVEDCAAALKRKEQRFRERAAALGLRFVKHTVSSTDKPMYFLEAAPSVHYGAETLEQLAVAFFNCVLIDKAESKQPEA